MVLAAAALGVFEEVLEAGAGVGGFRGGRVGGGKAAAEGGDVGVGDEAEGGEGAG